MTTTAFVVHQVPLLLDRGVAPSKASLVQVVFGASGLIGRLLTGWLLDRFRATRVMIAFLLGGALACALYATGAAGALAFLCAALFGLLFGAEFDVLAYLVKRSFGTPAFGRIYGLVFSLFQFGAGLGALALPLSREYTGSYSSGMMAFAVVLGFAGLAFAAIADPPPPPQRGLPMSAPDLPPLPTGRPRTVDEAREWMRRKLQGREHPMNLVPLDQGMAVIDQLTGLDGHSWGEAWGRAGNDMLRDADAAAARGDASAAAMLYLQAHGLFFLGRFPCPNHPRKLQNAAQERLAYLAAARYFRWPTTRVVISFQGLPGDGDELVFLYRRPEGIARPPVVLMWGGVDAWKEQLTATSDALLARGIATIAIDNPGTGESPVRADTSGERQFVPVLDWIGSNPDLQGDRVGLFGRSFGGYWATKLAHTHAERIAGAVSWGGGAHYMFQREWVEASRYPDSYLMELAETRSRMLGARDDAQYIEFFGRLSLLDQGLLERPCAPLLLVNGVDDRQCPVADIHLLTQHGSPKSVRLFPGGHMGHTPRTVPTMIEWLAGRLQRSPTAVA